MFESPECKLPPLFKNTSFAKTKKSGGGRGIRTPERVAPLPVFKTGAFNRSAIPPRAHNQGLRACAEEETKNFIRFLQEVEAYRVQNFDYGSRIC